MQNKIELSLALGLLVHVVMSTFCYEKVFALMVMFYTIVAQCYLHGDNHFPVPPLALLVNEAIIHINIISISFQMKSKFILRSHSNIVEMHVFIFKHRTQLPAFELVCS